MYPPLLVFLVGLYAISQFGIWLAGVDYMAKLYVEDKLSGVLYAVLSFVLALVIICVNIAVFPGVFT